MNYLDRIKESYSSFQEWQEDPVGWLEYLGDMVFGFTTYDRSTKKSLRVKAGKSLSLSLIHI